MYYYIINNKIDDLNTIITEMSMQHNISMTLQKQREIIRSLDSLTNVLYSHQQDILKKNKILLLKKIHILYKDFNNSIRSSIFEYNESIQNQTTLINHQIKVALALASIDFSLKKQQKKQQK